MLPGSSDRPEGFIDGSTRWQVRIALTVLGAAVLLYSCDMPATPLVVDPSRLPIEYQSRPSRGEATVVLAEHGKGPMDDLPDNPTAQSPAPPGRDVSPQTPPQEPDEDSSAAPASPDELAHLLEMLAPRPQEEDRTPPAPSSPEESPPEGAEEPATTQLVTSTISDVLPLQPDVVATEPPVEDLAEGTAEQLEGQIGPPYRFPSLDDYLLLARRHGGLLIAHDGRLTVLIGRSLDPGQARPRPVQNGDLPGYAHRMSGLPAQHDDVLRLKAWLLQEFPQLQPSAMVMLALPVQYDAAILSAQQAACREAGDNPAGLVTTGRFEEAGGRLQFRVLELERSGPAASCP